MATIDQVLAAVERLTNAVLGDGTRENPGLSGRVEVLEERCKTRQAAYEREAAAVLAKGTASTSAKGVPHRTVITNSLGS